MKKVAHKLRLGIAVLQQAMSLIPVVLALDTWFLRKVGYVLRVLISVPVFLVKYVLRGSVTHQEVVIGLFRNEILPVSYGGSTLFLTVEDLLQHIHKPERESHIPFAAYVSAGSVACDVGAHVGTHTLRLSQLVGTDGLVIALEPDLKNFGLLCLNVSKAKLPNVRLFCLALSDTCGIEKLYRVGLSMYFSLVRPAGGFSLVEVIDFKRLFELANVDHIDFMKIDIEGAEERLLLSETHAFVEKKVKVLYVDAHIGVDYPRIIEHLKRCGYRCEKIDESYLFRCED